MLYEKIYKIYRILNMKHPIIIDNKMYNPRKKDRIE